VRGDIANDADQLFERTGDGAGDTARTEHRAAERQEDQGERCGVVLRRLQAEVQQRLLDEHFHPLAESSPSPRAGRPALVAGPALIAEHPAVSAGASAHEIVAGKALERLVAGCPAA